MAKILVKYKHKIYMLPEIGGDKHPDAIMDNDTIEFKEVTGKIKTIGKRFCSARKQADNVFLNIITNISAKEIKYELRGEAINHKYETGIIYIYTRGKLHIWNIKDIK